MEFLGKIFRSTWRRSNGGLTEEKPTISLKQYGNYCKFQVQLPKQIVPCRKIRYSIWEFGKWRSHAATCSRDYLLRYMWVYISRSNENTRLFCFEKRNETNTLPHVWLPHEGRFSSQNDSENWHCWSREQFGIRTKGNSLEQDSP